MILSKNNFFIFDADKKGIGSCLLGVSVSLGNGVCRNIALNFKDILEELRPDVKITSIGTHVSDTEDLLIPSTDFIKKRRGSSPRPVSISDTENNKLANHLESLIFDNSNAENQFFLYDPTNFRITNLRFCNGSFGREFYDARTSLMFDGFDTTKDLQVYFKM